MFAQNFKIAHDGLLPCPAQPTVLSTKSAVQRYLIYSVEEALFK
jgi:hypothetical protein